MDAEMELMVTDLTSVTTQNSIYLLRPGQYCRTPVEPGERPELQTIDGKGVDNEWFDCEKVSLVDIDGAYALRILPAGRPPGSYGLLTSDVIRIEEMS